MTGINVLVTSTATLLGNFTKGSVKLQNNGLRGGSQPALAGNTVYIGPNSSVTTSNGLAFGLGSKLELHKLSETAPTLYGICASGNTSVLSVNWVTGA